MAADPAGETAHICSQKSCQNLRRYIRNVHKTRRKRHLFLSLLIGFPVFHLPATLTTKIIICCLTVLPLSLFAIIGIDGESLSSFALNFFIYRRNRRIVGLQTDTEEANTPKSPGRQKKKKTSEKKVKPRKEDFAEEFGQRKERRQAKQTEGASSHKDRRAAKGRNHATEEQEPSLLNPAASVSEPTIRTGYGDTG